ncbi:ABC transporter permease [Miltoncostaea oceani]|uniref:ABC transporter permease n=1 Tax=Miltoncostaea oceani TaxID=2843216 RepID=UPI001C3E63FA|nr:ABC transporter permease [Miltoncostaea oceani]
MAIDVRERWTENPPSGSVRWQRTRELWDARELVGFLALRDLKARYKQAVFGFGWAVVQPLAGALVFALVFRGLADVSSDGLPYLVFALVGFVVWSYFSLSLNSATSTLIVNSSMVTKVYFPRIAAPIAALLPGLLNMAVGFGVVAVAMVVFGAAPTLAILALPLCVLAAILVALGPSLILATLHVKYRDVAAAIGLVTQMWLLASPVAYPSSLVPDRWQWLYAMNPVAGLIDVTRWSIAGGPWPGPDLAISAGVALVLMVWGLVYFQRAERRFADII